MVFIWHAFCATPQRADQLQIAKQVKDVRLKIKSILTSRCEIIKIISAEVTRCPLFMRSARFFKS